MTTDTPPSAPAQGQTQSQSQAITINLQNSGDPGLEHRIFSNVHGVGRQLGKLAAVVDVLVAAQQEADPDFAQTPQARAALDAYRQMQADIEREKRRFDPQRYVEQLETLRADDPQAFAAFRERLRAWLDGQ